MRIHVNTDEYAYIPLNLHFFDEGEKTEQPTAKKRHKARSEGQVAKSQEIGTAFLFIAIFSALKSFAPGMLKSLLSVFEYGFTVTGEAYESMGMDFISKYINHMFMQSIIIVIPIFAVAMIVGILTNLAQVGWHPTTKPLMPKFSKLNPLSGIKRLFRPQMLVDLLKSLLKFAIIGIIIYNMLVKEIEHIPSLLDMTILESVVYIGNLAVNLGLTVGIYFLFIAFADLFYTRYQHTKKLKMTKQEVKEEHKQAEGNPQIKGKIRQKMREASMRRMMQSVPQADVIITNPTHYAVALKYDRNDGEAPVLLAKGVDHLAKRIKDAARENNIEIVENKQLARTLYATVDIGSQIPPELYQAVAEILAYVYKIKNPS